jgi:WD40 repeat protein
VKPRRRSLLSRLLAVLFLAPLASAVFAAPPLINSGHVGGVTALAISTPMRVLLSGGRDGAVRVWSTDARRIRYHLRLGAEPIERLVVHPSRSLVAVLRTSPGRAEGGFELSVWDWRAGQQVFSRSLSQRPLHVGFSSRGSWVIYTRPDWESVVLLDVTTGAERASRPGFGIVSFAATSTNERTLMTYQPGGRISYWNLASRRETASVTTVAGLEDLSLSADKRLLVGRAANDLFAIDVVSGSVSASASIDARSAVTVMAAVSGSLPEIAVASRGAGGNALLQGFDHGPGMPQIWSAVLPTDIEALAYGSRRVFIAASGEIVEVPRFGEPRPFSRDEMAPITGLAFAEDYMVVGLEDRVALVRSSFFRTGTTGLAGRRQSAVSLIDVETPFLGAVGVAGQRWLAEGGNTPQVWLWNATGSDGRLALLDVRRRSVQVAPLTFAGPLAELTPYGELLLAREPSGVLTLLNTRPLQESMGQPLPGADTETDLARLIQRQFFARGLSDAALAGTRLLAGTSRGSNLATALMAINIVTTETVPVPDSAMVIYHLAHAQSRLLTLGVEAGAGGPVTVLKEHTGADFERKHTLDRFLGEDLDASVVVEPAGRRFYSSLGTGSVSEWNGTRLVEMEAPGHQPRDLYVVGNLLLSLNADSTITVWDRRTRQVVVDLYVFRDNEWLAATRDGSVLRSAGGARYLASAPTR